MYFFNFCWIFQKFPFFVSPCIYCLFCTAPCACNYVFTLKTALPVHWISLSQLLLKNLLAAKLYFNQEGACTPKLRIWARQGKSTDLERNGGRNFKILGFPKFLVHLRLLQRFEIRLQFYVVLFIPCILIELNYSFRTPKNAILI